MKALTQQKPFRYICTIPKAQSRLATGVLKLAKFVNQTLWPAQITVFNAAAPAAEVSAQTNQTGSCKDNQAKHRRNRREKTFVQLSTHPPPSTIVFSARQIKTGRPTLLGVDCDIRTCHQLLASKQEKQPNYLFKTQLRQFEFESKNRSLG